MKRGIFAIVVLILSGGIGGRAADPGEIDWGEAIQGAQSWAEENLDEDVLSELGTLDKEKATELFKKLEQQFRQEYVIDLAELRDAVKSVLPLLESYEETYPYALWLKSRLDYFEVADELRKSSPAPPKAEPGKPPSRPPNPSAAKERQVWDAQFVKRPWPANAKAYVVKLKPVFASEKVPPELVWLAEVESSFDPRARSPVGAAGLFQLMPATAKRFGLRTWPLDQRLQPEESARAAAKYLNVLHSKFKDWRLALAAYNCGEGNLQKVIDARQSRDFDKLASGLPAETQMYVPKVEAAILHREGLRLPQLN